MRRFALTAVGILGAAVFAVLLVASVSGSPFLQQPSLPTAEALTLPRITEGTSLIVQQLVNYEGAFYEDGTGEEVTDTAALLLHNAGHQGIGSATVCVEQGQQKMTFVLTQLPAGGTVLVLEKDRLSYSNEPITACYGWMHPETGGWEIEARCLLEPVDMGSVRITNKGEETLKGVRLYYKDFYPEKGFYLGGITYSVLVESLEPGQPMIINPLHYAGGHSAFVRIEP